MYSPESNLTTVQYYYFSEFAGPPELLARLLQVVLVVGCGLGRFVGRGARVGSHSDWRYTFQRQIVLSAVIPQ